VHKLLYDLCVVNSTTGEQRGTGCRNVADDNICNTLVRTGACSIDFSQSRLAAISPQLSRFVRQRCALACGFCTPGTTTTPLRPSTATTLTTTTTTTNNNPAAGILFTKLCHDDSDCTPLQIRDDFCISSHFWSSPNSLCFF